MECLRGWKSLSNHKNEPIDELSAIDAAEKHRIKRI